MTTENTTTKPNLVRVLVIGVLIVAAFLGAYKFAAALSQPKVTPAQAASAQAGTAAVTGGVVAQGTQPAANSNAQSGSTPGCACCGSTAPTNNGVTGDPVEGAATVEGNVQKISVDLSTGTYNPNVIKLKAGVPAEITFGQSSGCTGQVQSQDLGFFEDLTQGPVTVKIPAQQAGEYAFSCGMSMVFGKIVVE